MRCVACGREITGGATDCSACNEVSTRRRRRPTLPHGEIARSVRAELSCRRDHAFGDVFPSGHFTVIAALCGTSKHYVARIAASMGIRGTAGRPRKQGAVLP